MAMLRERPVAKLSAALDGTKPNSLAAAETFSCVLRETEPRPDRALDAVDFDTPESRATSDNVAIHLPKSNLLAFFHIWHPLRIPVALAQREANLSQGWLYRSRSFGICSEVGYFIFLRPKMISREKNASIEPRIANIPGLNLLILIGDIFPSVSITANGLSDFAVANRSLF